MNKVYTVRAYGTLTGGPNAGKVLKGAHIHPPAGSGFTIPTTEEEAEICVQYALSQEPQLTLVVSVRDPDRNPDADIIVREINAGASRVGQLVFPYIYRIRAGSMWLGRNGLVRNKSAAQQFTTKEGAQERIDNLRKTTGFFSPEVMASFAIVEDERK